MDYDLFGNARVNAPRKRKLSLLNNHGRPQLNDIVMKLVSGRQVRQTKLMEYYSVNDLITLVEGVN
jgi:hypothetical protein